MIAGDGRPDFAAVLRPLKAFQRRTVEYVFRQLYQNPAGKGRFLVADEVGLGKTLVARGVVARTIEHLWQSTRRIDVIYICSNADIARQNVERLTIPGLNHFTPADRITLLPISTRQHDGRNFKNEKVNFVPLTPGTSFRMFSQFGLVRERALLYRMVQQALELPLDGAMHVFSGDADKKRFRYQHLANFDAWYHIDPTLAGLFLAELEKVEHKALRNELIALCQLFQQSRRELRQAHRWRHLDLVSKLRDLLAKTCMDALEPDLVIMDEFQRFKHLLTGDNPAGELAQALFNYPDVRILLLSATPYKMYTLHDEADGEDHHGDFLHTLEFLFDDAAVGVEFRHLLREYRQALLQYGNRDEADRNSDALLAAKTALESRLRQVMSRTEKLTASADRNGMFRDMENGRGSLQAQDLAAYVALQRVTEVLKHHNTLEYWKSAPYLLNFMENYQLKKHFHAALTISEKEQALARALGQTKHLLISPAEIEQYEALDPGNARLRQLLADTIEAGAWQLLWVPPSLPYYQMARPFDDERLAQFTKRLVFSAWHVVPKAVASLLSYAVERQMMRLLDETAGIKYGERSERRGLLRFSRSDGRLTGMPVLGILYPSVVLAELGDPLRYHSLHAAGPLPRLDDLLTAVQSDIDTRLAALTRGQTADGPVDESWYWAAPILLDWQADPDRTSDWWQIENLAARWSGEEDVRAEESSAWAEHVAFAQGLLHEPDPAGRLGRPPGDLAQVLAQMALAAPGVVALRALSRVTGGPAMLSDPMIRTNAAAVAHAFRSLFNVPEVMVLVRGLFKDLDRPYWQQLLHYSLAGCLQAVLDEYAHILCESLGLVDKDVTKLGTAVASAMRAAVQLRTASLKMDHIEVNPQTNQIVSPLPYFRLRSHFAQRFGDLHSDSDKTLARKGAVREAFNSPFWPFVLVTTSVGQEGLDFHQYCHAIVHWNLPANPVDLEQREGRVHRYKGHAIRKNLAHDFGTDILGAGGSDPWQQLFLAAHRDGRSDLVPFWIYPESGAARAYIERYVPILPLSRDAHRLTSLRKALTVYRMVFGQNRQEDLVTYLLDRLTETEIDHLLAQLQIDLRPPSSTQETSCSGGAPR